MTTGEHAESFEQPNGVAAVAPRLGEPGSVLDAGCIVDLLRCAVSGPRSWARHTPLAADTGPAVRFVTSHGIATVAWVFA